MEITDRSLVVSANDGGTTGYAVVQRVIGARVRLLAALVVLLFAIDWMYVNVLVALFGETGYPGYPFVQRPASFHAVCWVIGLVPAIWLPLTMKRPSQVLLWCLYLMVIIPCAAIGPYATLTSAEVLQMMVGLVAGFVIVGASNVLPPLRLPKMNGTPALFWSVIVALTAACYIAVVLNYGAIFRLVSLQDVYTQRLLAQELSAPLLVRYLIAWQELVINPLVMALGVSRRRPLLFFAGAAGQVVLFGVAAQRIVLATPFMVIGLHYLLRRGGGGFAFRATVASVVAFVGPSIAFVLNGGNSLLMRLLFDSLLNRLFLNSGFLTVLYFKFFSTHPKVNFAQFRPFDLFLTSPYSDNYADVLSWSVWGYYSHPNTNLLADGFAQLGYPGILIEAAMLAVLFWLLDSVVKQRGMSIWFAGMCVAAQVSSMANATPTNMLMSEGFGLLLFLMAIMPRADASAQWRGSAPAGVDDAASAG